MGYDSTYARKSFPKQNALYMLIRKRIFSEC